LSLEEAIKNQEEMSLDNLCDEGQVRCPEGVMATVIFIIGILWSLFHFYTAGTGLLTATLQRSAHLSVGLALCFLYYPFNRKGDQAYTRLPFYDIVLALAGFASIFYVFYFYRDLAMRVGAPTRADLIMGGLAIVLIVLAAHRAFGLVLPIVTLIFLSYPFLGAYLPGIIGHGGYRLVRVINDLYITNTGILGIPIGISVTDKGLLNPIQTSFTAYGPGLPMEFTEEYSIDNGVITVYHHEESRDYLRLWVTPLTEETLTVNSRVFPLGELTDTHLLLTIRIVK